MLPRGLCQSGCSQRVRKAATAAAPKRAAAKTRPAAAAAAVSKRPSACTKRPAAAAAAAPPPPTPPPAEDDDDGEDDGDEAMCEGEEGQAAEEEIQADPDEEVEEVDGGVIDGPQEAHQIGENQVRLSRRRCENITILQVKAPGCAWSQLAQLTDKQFQKEPDFLVKRGCTARQMADTAAKACCAVCVIVVVVVAVAFSWQVRCPPRRIKTEHCKQSFGHELELICQCRSPKPLSFLLCFLSALAGHCD